MTTASLNAQVQSIAPTPIPGSQAPSRETSPNRGSSLPQDAAISDDREALSDWKARNHIDASQQIRLTKVSHMRYQHPDLVSITQFLRDFGMTVAKKTDDARWYRGYGTDQYVYYAQKGEKKFLGGCFEVESMAELEKAAKLQNVEIKELKDAPGGGHMVTLTDPEGFPVNLLFGQTPAAPGVQSEILTTNYEVDKPRKAQFQRFKPGPAGVYKLGHFGLCVQNFAGQSEFYTRTFNLVPSDYLHVPSPDQPDGRQIVALFAHVDLGPNYTDHHTFFMSSNPTTHVHHCSFEVHDFDSQNIGHKWLASKGYKNVWGVGRHILGSQLFDYWWDTTGNMVEHYADGDQVNETTPIGYGPAGHESLAIWGPEVPDYFLD